MKIKKGFMLRSVGGRNIVVAVGNAAAEFNGMITLNDSGAFLWKRLSKGSTYDELVLAMLAEYDVSEETAKKDIDVFLENVRKAGLIDD